MLGIGLSLAGSTSSTAVLGQVPSLDLDFLTGAMPAGVTFTRASSATRFNASGVLETVATNVARFDYDPVTLVPRGFLVEEARTNILLRSEEFDNAAWGQGGVTVTANAALAPTGAVAADKLVESTTASVFHYINNGVSKAATAAVYTFSVYVKDAGRQVQVTVDADGSNGAVMRFNPATGAVTQTPAVYGSFTAASGTVTSVGNGWYRVAITATSGTEVIIRGQVSLHNGAAGVYTGDGVSGAFVFGAMLEAGAFPTSYIQTTSATVTRAADVAGIGTLTPWFNASEGTLFVEASRYALRSATTFVGFSDGTSQNFMGHINGVGTPAQQRADVVVGGATQAQFVFTGAATVDTVYKQAYAWKLNDFAGAMNGGTVLTDTSGTVPTVDRMQIGVNSVNSVWLCGHIRKIRYWRSRRSNTELQALTAS